MPFKNQQGFDVGCEWGTEGVAALADCRTFIVVDVLSFSTCVSMAIQRAAVVYPYRCKDAGAADFANHHHAVLAGPRGVGYSLSPSSLLNLPLGLRLVLPSPNGAAVSLEAAHRGHVLAGCLRNKSAVASRAVVLGGPYAIIPAGERWRDGTLRPAIEDLIGAGAIAAKLPGTRSPEAAAAIAVFESVSNRIFDVLISCSSGHELIERGFPEDVRLAAELDAEIAAPELIEAAFVASPVDGSDA